MAGRGRPFKEPDQRRVIILRVLLTPAERERLEQMANGEPLAVFAREQIFRNGR